MTTESSAESTPDLVLAYVVDGQIRLRHGGLWWTIPAEDLSADRYSCRVRLDDVWTECTGVYQYADGPRVPENGPGFSMVWKNDLGEWCCMSFTRDLVVQTDRTATFEEAQCKVIERHKTAAARDPRDLFDELAKTAIARSDARARKAWDAAILAWHRAYLDAAPTEIP